MAPPHRPRTPAKPGARRNGNPALRAAASRPPVLQLKVSLRYSRLPIWRRLHLRGDLTLAALHAVLQTAFGWEDSHLHEFATPDGTRYGPPSLVEPVFGPPVKDERSVILGRLLRAPDDTIEYLYDFGDSWELDILLEEVLAPDTDQPLCVGGHRAAPLEDSGGLPGYELLCEAIADPCHDEHDAMSEWLADVFGLSAWDPEAFDADETTAALGRLHLR